MFCQIKTKQKHTVLQNKTFKNVQKLVNIVKPVLSSHSKIDKIKVLKTNGTLMKVESIVECSPWSTLQYFWPALSNNQS